MLLWYWVYSDQPRLIFTRQELEPRAQVLGCFDEAAKLGMRGGQAVSGMWLIDEVPEQDDVLRIYGTVPTGIRVSHEAYLARLKATDETTVEPDLSLIHI